MQKLMRKNITVSGRVGENLGGGVVPIEVVDLGAIAAEISLQIGDHLLQGDVVSSVDGVRVIRAAQRVPGAAAEYRQLRRVASLWRCVSQEEQSTASGMKRLPQIRIRF